MKTAFVFSGQGSQYVGMGHGVLDGHAVARETFEEADEALGFSLSSLVREGPESALTLTENAQPAILVYSIALLRVLGEERPEISASVAAGHSLGEFSAHVAAGTLSFPDALRAVRLRGELMFAAGQARPGTMAALLGLGDDAVREICERVTAGICVPANFNSTGQVVVSGDIAGVEELLGLAKEAGARRAVKLNVSGAFHSPLMEPAAEGLHAFLNEIDFADPAFPVISNAAAELVTTGTEARNLLVRQLTSPVRWAESVDVMTSTGVDRFIELGPGNVLSTLNRRNAKGLPSIPLGETEDFKALEG